MKIKTSVTLSGELVHSIDQYGKDYKNRSDFIEAAVQTFIRQIIRKQQDSRDIEIINQNASRLNEEASDVLEYQTQL
jgi:metal-responsive CopG/Arc/MetJ family transcriptional regulator